MDTNTMRIQYHINEFCHGNYIIGIYYNNKVIVYVCHGLNLGALATVDRTSKAKGGCAASLKYRQAAARTQVIKEHAVDVFELCSLDTLNRVAHEVSKRPNRGVAFEKLVTEHYGQTWERDHLEWWNGPDIVVNGEPFQIKYDKATLCHEGQAGLEIA